VRKWRPKKAFPAPTDEKERAEVVVVEEAWLSIHTQADS
jgi:hypothetical protein